MARRSKEENQWEKEYELAQKMTKKLKITEFSLDYEVINGEPLPAKTSYDIDVMCVKSILFTGSGLTHEGLLKEIQKLYCYHLKKCIDVGKIKTKKGFLNNFAVKNGSCCATADHRYLAVIEIDHTKRTIVTSFDH